MNVTQWSAVAEQSCRDYPELSVLQVMGEVASTRRAMELFSLSEAETGCALSMLSRSLDELAGRAVAHAN
jgi:hypothetical protein